MNTFKNQWFSLAIVGTIFLAYTISQAGIKLQDDFSLLKFILISCIFLLSGFTIETSRLFESIKNWQLHVWVQTISFVVFPLITIATAVLSNTANLNNPIYIGFILLACFPTTITGCLVFTRKAGGNEECALFNAILGNVVGIFLTPLLIYFIIGHSVELDPLSAIKKLIFIVILPFIIGQICRKFILFRISQTASKNCSNWIILTIIFLSFINSFQQGFNLSAQALIYIIVLCLLLKMVTTSLAWHASTMNGNFDLADRKCLVITATQKTLALGLPIITVLFIDDNNLAVISLPIIAYHTLQLIFDGIFVGQMRHIH